MSIESSEAGPSDGEAAESQSAEQPLISSPSGEHEVQEEASASGPEWERRGGTTMLPRRGERPPLESAFVRVVATCGVVGIGVALGAILASQDVEGWIIGLVVAIVSVLISAVLWSSRRM